MERQNCKYLANRQLEINRLILRITAFLLHFSNNLRVVQNIAHSPANTYGMFKFQTICNSCQMFVKFGIDFSKVFDELLIEKAINSVIDF